MKVKHNTIHVYPTRNKQWSVRVKSSNGQIIATPGEVYTQKAHAVKMGRKVAQMNLIQELRNDCAFLVERISSGSMELAEVKQVLGGMLASIDAQASVIEVEQPKEKR